jgi:hypothetical protein
MNFVRRMLVALPLLAVLAGPALADEYADAIDVFKKAGESASFFGKSYGYAVFPSIGKAGLGIGGAHGSGRVYQGGSYVGDTSMSQLTIGLQAGGQAYRQMIFFENKESFDKFTNGNFEFGAQATAVAITAAASASTSTAGCVPSHWRPWLLPSSRARALPCTWIMPRASNSPSMPSDSGSAP